MEESIFSIESKDKTIKEESLDSQIINNNIQDNIVVPNISDKTSINSDFEMKIDLTINNNKKKGFLSMFGKKKNDNIMDINGSDINSTQGGLIIGEPKNNNGDIFQDLDLGSLSFLEEGGDKNQKKPFNPLEFTKTLTGVFFWISLVAVVGIYLNVLVLTNDSDFIHSIPGVCDYVGSKIEGYDNSTNCFSLNKILEVKNKEHSDLETNIFKSLSILIPKKIQTDYILSSPEVKFIQEKHTSDKIFLNKIFEDFENIRTSNKPFDGLNIECSNYKTDETGLFELSCNFYGAGLTSIGDSLELKTSRLVVLDFLKRLASKSSNFKVLSYPTNLPIADSNSTEGIKSRFSTVTNIQLKLQYSLESKL